MTTSRERVMTSRERVTLALNHKTPDRVPLDLGSTAVTGISAGTLHRLRHALGLEERVVRVHEPYQMLGQVDDDVLDALGVDVVGLGDGMTMFGYPVKDWKPFTFRDGTDVMVPGLFNTEWSDDGNLYQYPMGDKSVPPSGRMPDDGYYFDAIDRQEPYTEDTLDPQEWVDEMYHVWNDDELRVFEKAADDLFKNTSRAIICNFGQGAFGDIALVPGLTIAHPHGIRAVVEWYMATKLYPDYIHGIFQRQCDIALQNLALLQQAVGDKISAIMVSGTDFGTQHGSFISPKAYREMYMPYHKRINDWIHANTTWKTFYHSCGSMIALFDHFVEAGVDIVNPVQISATGMDPKVLKERWGDDLVFWGGGVDTQQVLPFGTPDEVRAHVQENVDILGSDGGFVFNAVHNIQFNVPTENLMACFQAFDMAR